MNQVTDSYILGIKEGRQFLQSYPDMTLEEMRGSLDSCTRLMRDHGQPMKDIFKGERDFWKNQLKVKVPA